MKFGKGLGLVLMAAVVVGAAPSLVDAAERVVLGEYFTNLY
ncbi:MAG: hypothetical protein ABFS37_08055 [Acidobacteriota bacterium]